MTRPEDVRKDVSTSYARAVEQTKSGGSCCCAGPAPTTVLTTLAGYSREALAALPLDAVVNSFGCGNPLALAEIRESDTVLDLGSGAGIDLLLAAKLVGPRGKVIGVDMTEAMIQRARANAAAAGLTNVDVIEGIIEDLPVESDSVDFVVSNCVINLSPEKHRVFSEIYRVLKTDGRFSISDIVAEPMPEWIQREGLLHSACISGAIPELQYLDGLRAAGLVDVAVRDRLIYDASQLAGLLDSADGGGCCCGSEPLPKDQLERVCAALAGKVASIRVVGRKPGSPRKEEEPIVRIQVFDPPMCCSTGVCGPNVDSSLVQFAADLAWLEGQGVTVERYNLSQQPQAFVSTPLVKESLASDGNDCLPLILVDGRIASKGRYPNREVLAAFAQIALGPAPKAAAAPCCCGSRGGKGTEKSGGGCC